MLSGVYSYASLLMPHCPVTVEQRYRDGVCSILFHSFFIICHPYIPLHLEEMTCYTAFWLCQCTIYNIGAKKRFALLASGSEPFNWHDFIVGYSIYDFI